MKLPYNPCRYLHHPCQKNIRFVFSGKLQKTFILIIMAALMKQKRQIHLLPKAFICHVYMRNVITLRMTRTYGQVAELTHMDTNFALQDCDLISPG